jgi:ankyrin repeat protein
VEEYIDVVKILLQRGADVQIRNHLGDTPLLIAAFQGYSQIVAVLLGAGADMEKKNFGEVALTLAVSKGHFPTVKLLLENGADINKLADDGKTALVKAIAAKLGWRNCFNVGCSGRL